MHSLSSIEAIVEQAETGVWGMPEEDDYWSLDENVLHLVSGW